MMMKIVHLVPHIGLGGDITVIKSMVRVQGDQVWVNGLTPQEAFDPVVTENPFPLNSGLAGFFRGLLNLKRLPADTQILHAHSPSCILFSLLARRLRCRKAAVVFTFHLPVPDHGWRRKVKGYLFNCSDVIHFSSIEMIETSRERYGVRNSKLALLTFGVDLEPFASDTLISSQGALRKRWNIDPAARVVGYLGRLSTEKNCEFLIRFLHQYEERFPDLQLAIAGTGDLSEVLRQHAASGPARDRIHFLGYTREPETVYPTFDLMVLPSDFEAFALVVVEAAYCGVPTLRSDLGGSREQIKEGVTGFVYSQRGGYEAMEAALLRILENHWDHLQEIGSAARKHCLELCDMDRFSQGLGQLYQDALDQR